MKISTRKITWMSVSFFFALLTGLPAVADDTELLLVNPDPSLSPKPNVMFILDTSGSMTTEQSTIDPYDSTLTYGTGNCDPTKYYWTDVDVTPDCATTNNIIDGDKYVCEFSRNQIAGIGSYTDTMSSTGKSTYPLLTGRRFSRASHKNTLSVKLTQAHTATVSTTRTTRTRAVRRWGRKTRTATRRPITATRTATTTVCRCD